VNREAGTVPVVIEEKFDSRVSVVGANPSVELRPPHIVFGTNPRNDLTVTPATGPSSRPFRDSGGAAPLLQLAQVMRWVRYKQRDGDVPDGRRVRAELLRRGSREVV
jgi:hypothetical protein